MRRENCTANIISELRREAGYTQKTLADALHITDKAVSKWERGICQPDSALLPKLSLLLDADIELLLNRKSDVKKDEWMGFIDLLGWSGDLSQIVYDKPLVYYMLSHFLLLDVRDIYIRTTKENEEYLSRTLFSDFGFNFTFDFLGLPKCNMMILNRPLFLFGSDLTRQFQGAMVSGNLIKLVPVNQKETFVFCPSEYTFIYLKNSTYIFDSAVEKTLGRGMISIEMNNTDGIADAAGFVRTYQNNSGLLAGSIEEIAYKKQIINGDKMLEISEGKPYCERLRSIIKNLK